jgi:hypothetical protein
MSDGTKYLTLLLTFRQFSSLKDDKMLSFMSLSPQLNTRQGLFNMPSALCKREELFRNQSNNVLFIKKNSKFKKTIFSQTMLVMDLSWYKMIPKT